MEHGTAVDQFSREHCRQPRDNDVDPVRRECRTDGGHVIPAFSQGVHTIAGTCGTFPMRLIRDRLVVNDWGIFSQPDPDQAPSITWTRVYEDLVLYPFAWMRITSRYVNPNGGKGFPATAVYEPFELVQFDADNPDTIYVEGREYDAADMIRFDSPVAPGALITGNDSIVTALMIQAAVRKFATMDIPAGYLKQTGGPDMEDDEIIAMLDGWDRARATKTTGFLNQNVDFNTVSWNAAQLQLVEARDANAVDIARILNMPPSAVNATTGGSLTYATTESQGRQLLNTTLRAYLESVTGRLSMPDITPRGQKVTVNLDTFLQSDAETRSRIHTANIASGVETVDEARIVEGLPPLATVPTRPLSVVPQGVSNA